MAEKDRIEQEAQDIYNKYYTQQNDPAKAGSDAFRRAVASQLRQSYETQRQTGQSYSDLYQQARRQATRMGAMSDVSGFSGGMAQGQAARASAAEIQALSGIAAQREGAMRDIAAQRQAIPSNALIESQQAEQYARAIQAANKQRADEIFEIIGSVKAYDKLGNKQKAQLRAYGITDEKSFQEATMITPAQTGIIDPRAPQDIIAALEKYPDIDPGDYNLSRAEGIRAYNEAIKQSELSRARDQYLQELYYRAKRAQETGEED